jgi:hypothetical protein
VDRAIQNIIKAWPTKASVTHWQPSFEGGPGYDYPLSTLPVDPKALALLDEPTKQALALSLWIQYNRRTIDAEDHIANPAIDYLLGQAELPAALRTALMQTSVDERYHTYFHTLALNEALSRSQVDLPFARSVTVREMMARAEACPETWRKKFVLVAYAAVAEVSVNAFLEVLSTSKEIKESNRKLVDMHNRDERFHTSIFISVVEALKKSLPEEKQGFLLEEIRSSSQSFLKHDFSMYRSVFAAHQLDLELITTSPGMSRDMSGVNRLLESLEK